MKTTIVLVLTTLLSGCALFDQQQWAEARSRDTWIEAYSAKEDDAPRTTDGPVVERERPPAGHPLR